MPVRAHMPGYRRFGVFRNSSVRTGVYVGVCLSLVFIGWILLANRVSFLERFALERNLAAALLLGALALVPILRFVRMPGPLLASSLIGWLIFSLTYRVLCMVFPGLSQRYAATQIFMLGAVVYLIVTTLSWLGTIIWRVRASNESHPNHHAS
jgi:hypothetical protein